MGMEHAPHVDVIVTLNVEDKMRIALQHLTTQTGQAKLVCISRRSGSRLIGD